MTILLIVLLLSAFLVLMVLIRKKKRIGELSNPQLQRIATKDNTPEPPQKANFESKPTEKKQENDGLGNPSLKPGSTKENTPVPPRKAVSESELYYVVRITYPWAVKYFIYPSQEQVIDPSMATQLKAEFARTIVEKVNQINTDPDVEFSAVTLAKAIRDFNQ